MANQLSVFSESMIIFLAVYGSLLFLASIYRPHYALALLYGIISAGFLRAGIIQSAALVVITLGCALYMIKRNTKTVIKKVVLLPLVVSFCFGLWLIIREILLQGGFNSIVGFYYGVFNAVFVPIYIAILAIIILQSKNACTKFFIACMVVATVFSIIALAQFFQIPQAWAIREWMGIHEGMLYQIEGRYRIVGLSMYVIPFSYQLATIIPISLSFALLQRISRYYKIIFLSLFCILFATLQLTFTRSAQLGSVVGSLILPAYFFIPRTKKIINIKKAGIIVLCIIWVISVLAINPEIRERTFRLGEGFHERIGQYALSFNLINKNPFGVGKENYLTTTRDFFFDIANKERAEVVIRQLPHNQFLLLAGFYGIPALLIAILLYFSVFSLIRDAFVRASINERIILIGFVASLVAYLIHASFHTHSPFHKDIAVWIILGGMLAFINCVLSDEKQS